MTVQVAPALIFRPQVLVWLKLLLELMLLIVMDVVPKFWMVKFWVGLLVSTCCGPKVRLAVENSREVEGTVRTTVDVRVRLPLLAMTVTG